LHLRSCATTPVGLWLPLVERLGSRQYWPAAMALLIEAGQMTASDYVPIYPDLPLASEGASTEAVPFFTTDRRSSPLPHHINERA
ncbi:hypothetical protein ACFX59_05215, partial [Sphingomonas sp. NCPPB 2930]|uniref:hypothetical protein n=1 Tax=Sphingomonas sp. NCPPB 2930 TaxID=3162788 RepID=UPI0036D9DF86